MHVETLLNLEHQLGYSFSDQQLLQRALTHRSFSNQNNEQLEFLGDAILNALIARILYRSFSQLKEGELSRFRSYLVCQHTLYEIAGTLQLGRHLRMGEGELKNEGYRRPSILADALEAILGAVWLDGGYNAVENLTHRLFIDRIKTMQVNAQYKDSKSLLQEWLQAAHIALPSYEVVKVMGVSHQQNFTVSCTVKSQSISALGVGVSRRAAEQAAAAKVYQMLTTMPFQSKESK